MPLWFFGNGAVLSPREREIVKAGILDPFCRFVNGEAEINWGTTGHQEVRVLRADGSVGIARDELWESALRAWGLLKGVQTKGSEMSRL